MNTLKALLLIGGILVPDLGHAQEPTWDYLGRSQVALSERQAAVPVAAATPYDAVRLHFVGAPVYLSNVRVTFADGTTQTIPVHATVDAGGHTAVLRLAHAAPVATLGLVYRPGGSLRTGAATVRVYGERAPAPPPASTSRPPQPTPIVAAPIRLAPVVRVSPYYSIRTLRVF